MQKPIFIHYIRNSYLQKKVQSFICASLLLISSSFHNEGFEGLSFIYFHQHIIHPPSDLKGWTIDEYFKIKSFIEKNAENQEQEIYLWRNEPFFKRQKHVYIVSSSGGKSSSAFIPTIPQVRQDLLIPADCMVLPLPELSPALHLQVPNYFFQLGE